MISSLAPGDQILHYEILDRAGQGGMGQVYKARDQKLGRLVALKLLAPASPLTENARQRFLLEARSASSLNHPNVVTIYSIEQVDGTDFIVMEYVEGRTLRRLIADGPLSAGDVLDFGIQISRGLSAAHSLSLIHRDVKPENILVTSSRVIKILDFGLAKNISHEETPPASPTSPPEGLTAAGVLLGTIGYMSPEQVRAERLDPRTDIFSLGCVLYEALTGKAPFQGPNVVSVLMSIANVDPLPASTFRSDLPAGLEDVLQKALIKDKNARFSSAAELGDALAQVLTSVQTDTMPLPESVIAHTPVTRYAKSRNVNIAYQVIGEGPPDLVFVMGWVSHLDWFWKEPNFARFLKRLASFSRLILFDKRGTGLSDPVFELPTLEQRMDDVRAVMDAVGSERAALFGISEGGPMCSLFAATYPERTSALIMFGTYARRKYDPEYPWAPNEQQREAFFAEIERNWGGPVGIDVRAPSRKEDPLFRKWWGNYLRMGASPGAAIALTKMNAEIDMRSLLASVRVPTLILHRAGDMCTKVEEARYLAQRIHGARLVEFAGDDHLPFVGDQDSVLWEIENFLASVSLDGEVDSILATVMCVQLTGLQATVSSEAITTPQERIVQYQNLISEKFEEFRGQSIVNEPAQCLASFDGPARAIRCARAIIESADALGLRVKAGLHTGECQKARDRLTGIPLRIVYGLADMADSQQILVSQTVRDLVAGSGISFEEKGSLSLTAVGSWQIYRVL